MKNKLLFLGATSLIITSVPNLGATAQLASQKLNQSTTPHILVAKKQTAALVSGKFTGAEKPTTGSVSIVTENGHHYLVLDDAFSTSNQGPDLHVLLDTSAKPPQAYQNQGSYVNLGRLHSYNGSQRYPIPDAVDPNSFKSVVIWCRMANATFGYAPLQTSNSMSAH